MILLNLLILLSAIPLDVMLPSYPDLASYFRANITDIVASIGIFAIGFSIAQLFVGPLSDRFGRKKLLVAGLICAIAGATGCLLAPDYQAFIVCRILQSAGCACFILAQAIVQDVFKGQDGVSIRIITTTLGGIYIACAPLLGSLLQSILGWRGSFLLFVTIAVVILLYATNHFNETATVRRGGFFFYGREYSRILRNRIFLAYSLIGALAFSCHLAFVIVSPILFLETLKMDNYQYSLVLLIYGLAYLTGGFAATYAAKRMETHDQIRLGLMFMAISGGVMWLMLLCEIPLALTVLLPMLLCTAGAVLVRPATATEAMTLFDEIAGTAAAVGGTIRFAAAGVAGGIVSKFGENTAQSLSLTILSSGVAGMLAFRLLKGTTPSKAT
ncbi:Bcr/CflA family efflux MFS transporter [Cupriavidus sp. D39]|uniref:Bcr/CflA family efflux MFS transporter n=1 Tax=Cupriavidus sp. D39 TaxID=2997877 RepID=UPI002272268D|nr:Bcr/CflA family efflux MFS transporter [Cupriavidus sp. D39]MCY0855466.1 Bcr/CflA family efflux MFS transporter [Cupriavidus sp. D39]